MLRTMAEFGLNRERDSKYCELARIALSAAKRTGDPKLVSRALFECARAGGEEGRSELVQEAEGGIDELFEQPGVDVLPIAVLTKAFCRFFFWDYRTALTGLERVLAEDSRRINTAELGLLYSGLGIANHFLGQFAEARQAFVTALGLGTKVGDDFRVAQATSNLCAVEMTRGSFAESIKYGEMSVRIGEACSSAGLLPCYTNLMDSYLLVGREQEAIQCLENARKSIIPERRWKLRCAFLIEAASFSLSQRNQGLTLDLVAQLESLCRGREQAVPMPGPYWKLIIFRESLLGDPRQAYSLARSIFDRFASVCPFHSLDIAAVIAWLEEKTMGRLTEETEQRLALFDSLQAHGKKALLTLQGFLTHTSRMETSQSHQTRKGSTAREIVRP